jgi:syntaxin-binding protein 1
MQIANVCITLNEFPYIRYYVPAHHGPLGALRPHESTRAVARPPENSLRWRTNLARGDQARQYEAAEAEVLSRVLAVEVQAALDEYKRANPDFPVRACIMRISKCQGLADVISRVRGK